MCCSRRALAHPSPPHPPSCFSPPHQLLSASSPQWTLESTVGGLGPGLGGGGGLRVGLPVKIRGEVRFRPDPATGAVREVWVKALAINERPVLPGLLSSWVQRSADGADIVAPDVARDARAIFAALMPWLRS